MERRKESLSYRTQREGRWRVKGNQTMMMMMMMMLVQLSILKKMRTWKQQRREMCTADSIF
jgi:hypothetical protein